ncbi:MAG: DUF1559 domain-containing protein [Pirellula sp.]
MLLLVTAIAAGICCLVVPAIQAARKGAREMACKNNLKQVGLGLLNFESAYRRFPLAIEISPEDTLWRSWRSQIYPTFMEQRAPFYDEATAWNSKTNARLINGTPITVAAGKGGGSITITLERVPWCFECPECKKGDGVNYLVITGEGTAFPKSSATKLSDFRDGLENTILVVESVTCTPEWTEPRDLDIDTMQFVINSPKGPSISSMHPKGPLVCFADMEVYCVNPEITEAELRALISINGGEDVKREDLVSRGVLVKR